MVGVRYEDLGGLNMTDVELLNAGFKANYTGFYYILDAVKLKQEDPTLGITKIYAIVALHWNSTESRVERSIRHCIKYSPFAGHINHEVISALAILYPGEL